MKPFICHIEGEGINLTLRMQTLIGLRSLKRLAKNTNAIIYFYYEN
jgi:hypothetical protein